MVDALSLLANIVMAWNTAQMQAVLDRWANHRQIVPQELTGGSRTFRADWCALL